MSVAPERQHGEPRRYAVRICPECGAQQGGVPSHFMGGEKGDCPNAGKQFPMKEIEVVEALPSPPGPVLPLDFFEELQPLFAAITPPDGSTPDPLTVQAEAEKAWRYFGSIDDAGPIRVTDEAMEAALEGYRQASHGCNAIPEWIRGALEAALPHLKEERVTISASASHARFECSDCGVEWGGEAAVRAVTQALVRSDIPFAFPTGDAVREAVSGVVTESTVHEVIDAVDALDRAARDILKVVLSPPHGFVETDPVSVQPNPAQTSEVAREMRALLPYPAPHGYTPVHRETLAEWADRLSPQGAEEER